MSLPDIRFPAPDGWSEVKPAVPDFLGLSVFCAAAPALEHLGHGITAG